MVVHTSEAGYFSDFKDKEKIQMNGKVCYDHGLKSLILFKGMYFFIVRHPQV